MSRQVLAYKRIQTDRPSGEVLRAVEDALRRLGRTSYRNGTEGFVAIENGSSGVALAFMARIDAVAAVRQRPDGSYEVNCTITVWPSGVFWLILIVGFFCLWPLWVFNVLYFMIDPLPVYQAALDRIELPPSRVSPTAPAP